MASRRTPRRLALAALALSSWTACGEDKPKDKSKDGDKAGTEKASAPAPDLDARCGTLAAACSDTEKHVAKVAEDCRTAAGKVKEQGCAAAMVTLYDCFETTLCGKKDVVWTLGDLQVLAERHEACVAERDALRACIGGDR